MEKEGGWKQKGGETRLVKKRETVPHIQVSDSWEEKKKQKGESGLNVPGCSDQGTFAVKTLRSAFSLGKIDKTLYKGLHEV